MFVRKKKNKAGSTTIQVVSKSWGKSKVIKTIGHSSDAQHLETLRQKGRQTIQEITGQPSLFYEPNDALIEAYLGSLDNGQIRVVGPELVFGKLYDRMGLNAIKEELFRHLVITRLVNPGSKLKTVSYLKRYQGVDISVDKVYRFMDVLQSKLKTQVEDICYAHTKKVLEGQVSIVFYDMTTLYFESEDEDDLRKTGFSKEGKHQQPQIYLGLLVGLGGYAIGYEIYEGNIYEGHTLIPVLQKFEQRFNLSRPIVVADAGLLSKENIALLIQHQYCYILGARIKNESHAVKQQVLSLSINDGEHSCIVKQDGTRLIISYSEKRAIKDEHNRKRGLKKLEKSIRSHNLTKSQINNRGYNKYLKLKGNIEVEIDYDKFEKDKVWDGLKGYLTNTDLTEKQIMDNYKNLWHVEKAFRISKTDLRIRPVYHHLRRRIEAHICISFTAYAIYKEMERLLYKHRVPFSVNSVADNTQNMYQISVKLPESKAQRDILLNMDENQRRILEIVDQN